MGEYFIKVDDAPDLRRKILESSKATIHILRGYQQLIRTRNEKRTMLKGLRRELKELTMLLNRADELSPRLTKGEVQELNPKAEAKSVPARKVTLQSRQQLPQLSERKVYLGRPEPVLQLPAPVKTVSRAAPTAPVRVEPKKKSELELLHDKLSSIEEKLNGL